MPSLLSGYEYDVFISYRQNDNRKGWVTEFVKHLNEELAATIKETVSVYFDTNVHDGLSDNHDVDLSLGEKVKSLILIPIISQTYCDQKSYAWKSEFLPFKRFASTDSFGLKLKVANGNVASRILPVRIHELGKEDITLLEKELDGVLRSIDFTFSASGINRPLALNDEPGSNLNKAGYGDQINKVANAIKELLEAAKSGQGSRVQKKRGMSRIGTPIPIPATHLFGRDRELAELTELIESNKVTTLLGPGGMGKTRMALELSHRLLPEYEGNIAFAAMAALTSAEQVMPALADTLGIKEAEGRTLVKGISAVIGDSKALLVLDNLEQVIGVAPQVAELISNCPNLKILVTSRTPLKIRAEFEYALLPLLLPTDTSVKSVETLMEYPSVSLFVDRARKVNGTFHLTSENAAEVAQLCKRLDGMPLALELAAARIRMMSPKQLLQKLQHALDILTSGSKDLPERHQTLRATIDWSYTLLTEPEKTLFRRMAVFAGGCTLEGIEQTCYEKDSTLAFEALESLVDKGLVQHVGASDRFMMLETIKEYATEKFNEASELKLVKLRQVNYFMNVAAKVRAGLEGGNQVDAMRMGISEESNLESVLDFLLNEARRGDETACETGLTICGELFFFWHIRGKHFIARHYSSSFLNLPVCPVSSLSKSKCLNTAGLASSTLGQCDRSIEEHQAAYTMATMFNDKSTMGYAMLSMFIANLGLGKIDEAANCVNENLQLTKSETDFEIAFAHTGAGILHLVRGEFDAARKEYDLALGMQNKIPDLEGGGLSLGGLAMVSFLQGNFDEAIKLYGASLHSFATIGDRAEEARILEEMAWVHLKTKDSEAARKSFLDSIQAYEDIGSVRGIGLALHGIAGVEAAEGRPSKAIEIATAAQLFTEQEGIVNSYGEGFQGKVYLEEARKSLSRSEVAKAIESGAKLSLKDTLEMASG